MIKNNFKTSLIKDFKNTFSAFSGKNNYLFIGKCTNWTNEPTPDLEIDTFDEEIKAWNNMLAAKKIRSDEVVLCVRKIMWESNKIYSQYDDILEMYSTTLPVDFYVMTQDKNIYKCISNNYGSKSLYPPSGTSTELIKTQDGYIWKYLYSIRPELDSFITNDFIPVEYLDRLIYDEQDLRNEQLAVEIDAKFNGGGSISNVIVEQQGAPYLSAIDYVSYGSEIDYPEALHFVQSYSISGSNIFVGLNRKLKELPNINNFYAGGYVIYIDSGPGVGEVKDILSYDSTTGIISVSSKFSVPLTGESSYKILPKVTIRGDGIGASCISVLDPETKFIKEIKILNRGKNYRAATAEVKIIRANKQDQTILRAVKTPLYGHGGEAALELGCKNLLIKMEFAPKDNVELRFFNDYRQIGIIQNPILVNTSTVTEKTILEIESFSANQDLKLFFSTPNQIPITEFKSSGFSKIVGKTIVQGNDNDPNQVIGVISSMNYTQNILNVHSLKGRFRTNMGDPSERNLLVIKDYPVIGQNTALPTTKISSVSSINHYTNNSFTPGMKIIGETSYTTAIVDSWIPNNDGISGKLIVKNINGKFMTSYYDTLGNLKLGEKFVSVKVYLEPTGRSTSSTIFSTLGYPSSGMISGITQNIPEENTEVYRTTTVVQVSRPAGVYTPFSPDTFTRDALLKQIDNNGETIGLGIIVDWVINTNDKTLTSGYLLLNMLEGEMKASTSINLYEYSETLDIYNNVMDVIVCSTTPPSIKKYTGNMIYINNTLPIRHGTDSSEQIKLVIGF